VGGDGTLGGLNLSATTHTNAGNYTGDAWTFTDSTGNYNNTSGTVNSSIGKANANCSSIAGYTVTYDASSHTASGSCQGVGGDGTLTGLNLGATTHTNAGTYPGDAWAFTDVSGNYNNANGTVNSSISKANANCSSIAGYTVTYDASSHTASGSCQGVGGDGTLTGLNLGATTHTNAGTYTGDAWTFTDASGNYNNANGTVNSSISKANADCSSIAGYTVTYNAASHTASGSCQGVGGDGTLTGLDLTATIHTIVGTYTGDAWAFTDSTGNYNNASGTVNSTINKANANCSSIAGYTVTYDAAPHTASGSCQGVGGDGILAGLDLSATIHTIVGTYAGDAWTFTDSTGNYNDASGTVNNSIGKANADCSSIAGYTVTYNASSHTATGTCQGVGGDGILAGLNLSATTHTNAGTYTGDAWTFTDGTGNYNNANGTVNSTIGKADPDCSSIAGYEVTFDGAPHTATGTCQGVGGDGILTGLDLSATTHTAVGTYTGDPWTFTDVSGNYNNASGTVNDIITPKLVPPVTASGGPFTYDGTPHAATVTSPVAGTVSNVRYDGSLTEPTNAGSYAVTADFLPVNTSLYETLTGVSVGSITINKATADCSSIAGYTVTYDAAPHTATGTCQGVGGDGILTGLDLSATTHTNAGTYTGDAWTFTDVSGNYNNASGTVNNTINQATPTVSVTNSPVNYSGAPQAAIVTGSVTGVVSNIQYNGSSTIPSDIGVYTVTADFVPADTTNYSSLTGASAGNFAINANQINVTIDGILKGSYQLLPAESIRDSYNAVDSGPVKITSVNGIKILSALRVIWKEPGFRASYSEMMGLPKEGLSSEYWFPWYNNLDTASMDQGFRIANVDSSGNTVEVWVGNTKLTPDVVLGPRGSTRVGYAVNSGPIRIVCTTCTNTGTDKIIAALRVIWKEPGKRYSYSEMMGLPKEQLSNEYWFPWYNNMSVTSMDQGFRIANVDLASGNTVEVWVGNTKLTPDVVLGPGGSVRVGYPVDSGPIRIVCTTCTNTGSDKIIAALRVIWLEPGKRYSYSEMMGLPKELLSTEYWFPWYNNATPSMDQGFRIAIP
jgi:hypothetical protein